MVPAFSAQDTGAGLLCVTFLVALPRALHTAGGTGGFLEGLQPRATQQLPQEGKLLPLLLLLSPPALGLRQEGALWAHGRGHETVGLSSFPRRWTEGTGLAVSPLLPSAAAPRSVRWPRPEEIGELPQPWQSPAPRFEQPPGFPLFPFPFPSLLSFGSEIPS